MSSLTPDITEVAVFRHGVVELTFADGLKGEVEILPRMRGPVFERGRTQQGFAEVEVDQDTLYERVRTGAWPESRVPA